MSIRVTCPNCHTRFNVSEKFAGKEGPCPKCKKVIRVPDATEEVKVHEREVGPKDSKGRAILKPIARQETKVSNVQMTLIIAGIVTFLVLALVMRLMIPPEEFPQWLLMLSAIAIAPPTAYAAYTFLRNQELGTIPQDELIKRVGVCSVVYALLWFAMPLAKYAFNDSYEMGSWMVALAAMLGIGGAAGMFSMDFDYLFGLIHYGLYLVVCLLGRIIAGIGILPGINSSQSEPVQRVAPSVVQLDEMLQPFFALVDFI
ncbi:hypothetical protein N9L06_03895 [Mariniblastus sp.]|nr:hypothetical protein [Mariniblastus sp.]